MKEFELQRQEPDYDDEAPSPVPCYACKGPMVMGEEKAGGLCTNCYFKFVDEINPKKLILESFD